MPAQTSVIPSVDFLIRAGANNIGFGTGGTLTLNQALNDAFHDQSANWQVRTLGARSWSLTADGIVNEGGTILTGHDNGTDPLEVTIGGVAIKGITEASLALSLDVAEVVNSTTGLDRALDPAARSVELSVSADYYDPAGTGATALDVILDELTGTTTAGLAVVVSVGGMSLSFTARPSTSNVTKSVGEILKAGLTLVSTGAVTNASTGLDSGVSALLAAFFATDRATPLTVLAGTTTEDNTEFSGSAYPSSVTITIPFAGHATVSATLEGTGVLTRGATAPEA